MILINLLPYREERRKWRKQAFFAGLGLSLAAGVALGALGWILLQSLIDHQQSRNAFLTSQIKTLDEQIKDIATLREEIDALTQRQKAVEALQAERNTPVHLLNELARLTPEGVYLTALKQTDGSILLTGLAHTQERVSEYLRNIGRDAQWIEKPALQEVKLTNVTTNIKGSKRLFEFSVKVTLKGAQGESGGGADKQPKKG
ncbi:PilN domain-containing protein [Inhella gelatinilytica]|uniref:PilN domain-containing protein n=1 Tax=Inhella gelatinilytica TaxID=2795030 RepID=A0A931IYN9_9BURK|nr:PilN domain-containing protein [Inhella gelatinilytica]MBH9552428.1 PilN domain-containing protein [Inhella gelatinilytica]